jgi:septum site-determining protein MinD
MAVNPNSHIIGVAGGKGGVGKSVVAANLSLSFLLEMRQPTALIDLDSRGCGDQCFILGLREAKTIADLCAFQGAITPQSIASAVTAHPQSGLGFVAGVRTREETFNPPLEVALRQIEALTNIYRYVIVDLGSEMGPLQMSVIERATAVLIVTLPEVLAINQTARFAGELLAATLPADMALIVVNKATPSGLQPAAVAQTLRRSVVGAIPQDDITAGASLQRSTPFALAAPKSPIAAAHYDIVRKLTGGTLQQLKSMSRPKELKFKKDGPVAELAPSASSRGRGAPKAVDARTALKLSVHAELIKAMDLKKNLTDTQGDPEKEKELRRKTQAVITALIDREGQGLGREERGLAIKEILDEALGLGCLEDLLDDPAVTEIMVNGPDKIYVEKDGKIGLSNMRFTSAFHLRKVIERIVSPLGRQINESSPYVDARLRDGSRVNAVIEPLALDGAALTIRKFRKKPVSPETYCREWNACSPQMMEFLRICVANGLNIIISGGTGSGKTTLLNTLSGCSSSRITWSAWKRAPKTWRAPAKSRFATSCETRCACGPTGSSLASAATGPPSTCWPR